MMKQLLLGCAALLMAEAAIGQIMECVDAKGSKTIAQFCPPGTVKENKLMKGGTGGSAASGASGTTPAASSKSVAEREAEFKKRGLERHDAAAKTEKEQAESRDAQRNCDNARAQLRQLEEGLRISKIDPNTGERSFLDDNERPAEIERAKKSVESWCKTR